ncbi:sigma factor-like helix-turn-helix DNA-binding protein [Nonomuraea recticatena]|uniref:sigma factor-like helix-turn-helix DNA-binding protein n=1 Tax=Nonomuraea recticatena TaxID=46178 RepID=UPI003616AB47
MAWAGLSYPETAEALGVRLGTVRSRVNRARLRLRKALGAYDPMATVSEEPVYE